MNIFYSCYIFTELRKNWFKKIVKIFKSSHCYCLKILFNLEVTIFSLYCFILEYDFFWGFFPLCSFNFRELLIVSLTFLPVGHCCVVDWENRERPMFYLYQFFVTFSWLYFFLFFNGEVENTWYIEVDFLNNLKWYREVFFGQNPIVHCREKSAELFF